MSIIRLLHDFERRQSGFDKAVGRAPMVFSCSFSMGISTSKPHTSALNQSCLPAAASTTHNQGRAGE